MAPRTDSEPRPDLPEILRSAALAKILTPLLLDLVTDARARAVDAQLSRVLAEPLAALAGLAADVRRYHGLPPLDGARAAPDNGRVPARAQETVTP